MMIASIIKKQLKHQKLSHLYMIVGPKGSLRQTLIKDIIETVLEKSFETLEEALTTSRCFHMTAETSVIKKDQVLELQEEFSKTSLEEGLRVFIVEDIDQLNSASANSLLKFLEEPSGSNTTGFLFTNKPQAILDTIKSRAQTLYMKQMPDEEIIRQLKDIHMKDDVISYMMTYTKDVSFIKEYSVHPSFIEAIEGIHLMVDMMVSKSRKKSLLLLTQNLVSEPLAFEFFTALIYRVALDLLTYPHHITFTHLKDTYEILKESMTDEMLKDLCHKIERIQFESRYFVSLDMLRRRLIHVIHEYI
jgi:DNA polymerase III subunit delta'